MRSLGICLGASSASAVLLEGSAKDARILRAEALAHGGEPQEALLALLDRTADLAPRHAAVTGRTFRDRVQLPAIPEVQAAEAAYRHLRSRYPPVDAVVSVGGETFMVYGLDRRGRISSVHTGNKCASGTGDFFLQQIQRMGLGITEALDLGRGEAPFRIASRCSVFAKSDCTHALNKGEPKGRVVAGLCRMIAGKVLALVKKAKARRILLVGGTAQNTLVVEALREELDAVIVPEEAPVFEALGTALWALAHRAPPPPPPEGILKAASSPFAFHPPLREAEGRVHWSTLGRTRAEEGDACILGLDVGSTTTKAVLLRRADDALLASAYLRTNGDPVTASRACYRALADQLEASVSIQGLGVTGSGRQIAGLHAMTEGVVNEILAHATAAAHFDPEVDTIFEIGGQDAKYTHLAHRVACDYAMNEACSAGTGSFLEEAARESLGLDTHEIAEAAMAGERPPDFNDQCAAFIASDIKTAIHEGLSREDIAAGLVYGVCLNYLNRVKAGRPVGRRVFMQGGVCYNRAVPIAMAALTGSEIVVPPEPGLMGAYGVALEVKHRLDLGLLPEQTFDLGALAEREVGFGDPFTCAGGPEGCDLKCRIARVEVAGQTLPFGGSCNRYVNLRRKLPVDAGRLDRVADRERRAVAGYTPPGLRDGTLRVGLNRSLLVHALFPLYRTFFEGLGCEVVLPRAIDPEGADRCGAAFCYPVELAHGACAKLLAEDTDAIFLPQVRGMFVERGAPDSVVCPLAQGEPYVLKAAFRELRTRKLLAPVLDFSRGLTAARGDFLALGRQLGADRARALRAFREAVAAQEAFVRETARAGREALEALERDPEQTGIVVFGRPYNAFTQDANRGIPHKFASRGHLTLPMEALAFTEEAPERTMYWSMGQVIMKAARFVARHPQLFGAYITNFSCGPDSFLLSYVREAMGRKPTLTLELDGHTADAGLDTRIEAFLDIVAAFREVERRRAQAAEVAAFRPARLESDSRGVSVLDSAGGHHSLWDPAVKIILPAIGDRGADYLAAAFRRYGARAEALPPPTDRDLKTGRGHSTCKECLPYALVVGSCLEYLQGRRPPGEVTVIFLPESSGPCRFGQYTVQFQKRLEQLRIPDAAILSMTCENGYAGLGQRFQLRAWKAVLLQDAMNDIYSAILVLARDRDEGLRVFETASALLEEALERRPSEGLRRAVRDAAAMLAAIPRTQELDEVPHVGVAGEIFVRRDSLSRQFLVERLAAQGIVCRVAPVHEWMYYTEYIYRNAIYLQKPTPVGILGSLLTDLVKSQVERRIKSLMAASGLCRYRPVRVGPLLRSVEHLLSSRLVGGDAALTVAAGMNEILDEVHGFIAIGPFGCLPNRIAEAILTHTMDEAKPGITCNRDLVAKVLEEHPTLPFLAIESDGGVFPQALQAKLENFCLQVHRIHDTVVRLEADGARISTGVPGA